MSNAQNSNERGLVGSILMDADRVLPVMLKLGCRDDWFTEVTCKDVFLVVLSLKKQDKPVDLVTTFEEWRRMYAESKPVVHAPSIDALSSIVDGTPTSAHCEFYAQNVREAYLLRQSKWFAKKFEGELHAGVGHALRNLSGAVNDLLDQSISGTNRHEKASLLSDLLGEFNQAHDVVMVKGGGKVKYAPGLPMPWHYLNMMYCSARPGLHIIAARPSVGKTTFINNCLRFWCERNIPGGINSMDMDGKDLIARNVSEMAGVSLPKMLFGMSRKDELKACQDAAAVIEKWPLEINRITDLNEFRTWVTLGVIKHNWQYVVIDYIQLLKFPGSTRMTVDDRIAEISSTVKGLAQTFRIPIFAIAQLNRECEKDGGREPMASDLRGGGALEQDASTILMLHAYGKCEDNWKLCPPIQLTAFADKEAQRYLAERIRPVFAVIVKNQQGSTGKIPFVFYKNYFRFCLGDYMADPVEIMSTGNNPRVIGHDYSPQFCRIIPDWRQFKHYESLARSHGLVTEYEDGDGA